MGQTSTDKRKNRSWRYDQFMKLARAYAAFFIRFTGVFTEEQRDKLINLVDDDMDEALKWINEQRGWDLNTLVELL